MKYYELYWFVLHTYSLMYPEKPTECQRNACKALLGRLAQPKSFKCDTCRIHYKEFLDDFDIEDIVSSRTRLKMFFIDLHNTISRKLGKETWSVRMVEDKYSDHTLISDKINVSQLFTENKIAKIVYKMCDYNRYGVERDMKKLVASGMPLPFE